MARKSKYDQLVDSIGKRLREMAPENCETIEQAVSNDQVLADAGLAAPSTAADYSLCPSCKRPAYRGICAKCK